MAICVNGNEVKFEYGDSESSMTAIPELKEIPEFGSSPEKVETTHMTSKQKTYIQGIGDSGDMEFKFNYDKTIFAAIDALGSAPQKVKVTLSDKSTFEFGGQFSIKYNGGGVNSVAEMTIAIALNTDLKFTPGSDL